MTKKLCKVSLKFCHQWPSYTQQGEQIYPTLSSEEVSFFDVGAEREGVVKRKCDRFWREIYVVPNTCSEKK